jgi:hypothetical protein
VSNRSEHNHSAEQMLNGWLAGVSKVPIRVPGTHK